MIKKLLISLALISVLLAAPPSAFAAATTDSQLFSACGTNSQTANSAICKDQGTTKNPVNHTIKVATDIVALLTGAAAVIAIIISGFMFVTAGGGVTGQRSSDPNRLKTARASLTAAITGLVIVALAWTIITFLTDRLIK